MKKLLDTLLQDARVWQAGHRVQTSQPSEPTGYKALDHQLQGVGWPRGALTECFLKDPGIGELQLLLPLMRRQLAADKIVFWVSPPHIPYAPALEREGIDLSRVVVIRTESPNDALWSLENCLRSSVTGLVVAWPDRLKPRDIRRLQLAAEAGGGLCILFRDQQAAADSSPAALRLQLTPSPDMQLNVQILKRRGGWSINECTLPLPGRVPEQMMDTARIVQGPWTEPSTPKHAP